MHLQLVFRGKAEMLFIVRSNLFRKDQYSLSFGVSSSRKPAGDTRARQNKQSRRAAHEEARFLLINEPSGFLGGNAYSCCWVKCFSPSDTGRQSPEHYQALSKTNHLLTHMPWLSPVRRRGQSELTCNLTFFAYDEGSTHRQALPDSHGRLLWHAGVPHHFERIAAACHCKCLPLCKTLILTNLLNSH